MSLTVSKLLQWICSKRGVKGLFSLKMFFDFQLQLWWCYWQESHGGGRCLRWWWRQSWEGFCGRLYMKGVSAQRGSADQTAEGNVVILLISTQTGD